MTTKQPDAAEKPIAADAKRNVADLALMRRHQRRTAGKPSTPGLKIAQKPNAGPCIAYDGKDDLITLLGLMEAFGTSSPAFQNHAMVELMDATLRGGANHPFAAQQLDAIVAAMQGINPRDEIEGMLASQMVATHFMAMRLMGAAKKSENIYQQDSNGNLAIKLLRTFTMQMEALQRYRGKGQQKVTVEHVHVHAGGQAIVGNVTHPEGGGASKKTEEQPHAKQIDHAPEPAMPIPDTTRETLPIPRNAER
ncbi:MAG: hypothetical protein V4735_00930 [Pseudomonadota bacterium]